MRIMQPATIIGTTNNIARLYNEYDVASVDRDKTVEKIKAKKSLSKAQQQIVDRYATNKR